MDEPIAPQAPDAALEALAERACQAAGTDLGAALEALAAGRDETVPAALAAGWRCAETPVALRPTLDLDDEETP